MKYKVIVWGTGRVGKSSLIKVINHPDFELVGTYVYSEKKVGKDAGEICGLPETGIKATNSLDEILALEADVVIHVSLPSGTDDTFQMDSEVRALLESGKNVISTCGFRFLPYGPPKRVNDFVAACEKGRATLYGTGENPGFFFERFATSATSLCQDIEHITLEESSDCSHWVIVNNPAANMMQFGIPPEDYDLNSPLRSWYDREFGETLAAAAEVLNLDVEGYDSKLEIAAAHEDIKIPGGTVKKGTVSAQRYSQFAYVAGKPFLTFRSHWVLTKNVPEFGCDKMDFWKNDDAWRILIEGKPSFEVTLNLTLSLDPVKYEGEEFYPDGQHPMFLITSSTAVNAIPYVCAAKPGLMRNVVMGNWSPKLRHPGFEPPVLDI
jgi:hypothetical protein